MNTQDSTAHRAMPRRLARAFIAGLVLSGVLGGCVAVMGGAIVGGSMMAVDRRSAGTQLDDQGIELRAAVDIPAAIGDKANVSATSFNRVLLLTGEVPTEEARAKAGAVGAKIANVRSVLNELAVMPNASINQMTGDTITTGKVKAAFIDTPALQVASIKVVTSRGVVYLMGLVTEAEAKHAANAARSVGGVKKVVTAFDIITPAQLADIPKPPSPAKLPASAPTQ